jgi:hypothetical protein
MPRFRNLELVGTYPTARAGGAGVRVYRTPVPGSKQFRYHFGIAKKAAAPILGALESAVGWRAKHWREHDGYLLWVLPVVSAGTPRKALQKERRKMGRRYKAIVEASQKFAKLQA